MNKIQNEQTKKWLLVFGTKPLKPGIYMPSDVQERHGLVLMPTSHREVGDERVYEVSVPIETTMVVFVTDSIDVLKGLCNRVFPLTEIAEKLVGTRAEVIFEGGYTDGTAEGLEVLGMSLRVIPRADIENCFEVRTIK